MIWKLAITLESPACFGRTPLVGNESLTLDYIPATAIRGAIAAPLARNGKGLDSWFGVQGPRWLPAWPAPQPGQQAIPMPLSFVADKGDKELKHVHNSLYGDPPAGSQYQWQRVKSPWLVLDDNLTPVGVHSVQLGDDMHVAMHYGKQSHREAALYSRSSVYADLHENPLFNTWVIDPSNSIAVEQAPARLAFGKRRSTGGSANVVWTQNACSLLCANDCSDRVAYLQLMTDTILPSADGGYMQGLDTPSVSALLNDDKNVKVTRGYSAHRLVPGWSGMWGLPREHALVISASSVYKLENVGGAAGQRLKDLVATGIGLRRNEGFGAIALNPPWLTAHTFSLGRSSLPLPPPPLAWPQSTSTRLPDLAARAADVMDTALQARFEDLASYAVRVSTPQHISEYLERMAGRQNPHSWDKLKERLSGLPIGIEEWRFFLSAAALFSRGNNPRKDQHNERQD